MRNLMLGALALTLALTACDKQPKVAKATSLQVKFNTEEFNKLSDRVAQLEQDNKFHTMIDEMSSVAYLKPSDSEYQPIKIDLGYVTVSVANVSEYANGSKVTLTFGNPNFVSLSAVAADLEWGKVDESGNPTGPEHKKNQEFTDPLPPGAWHNVEVNLPDVSPKELGYIRVKNVTHKSISLRPTN